MYSVSHHWGWQKCLRDFGLKGKTLPRLVWEAEIRTEYEPFSGRGDEDGYNACRAEIVRLLSTYDETALRRFAKAVYCPPPTVPPPPRRDTER
jgi:hypothetical protein